jgi:hypothetical protein
MADEFKEQVRAALEPWSFVTTVGGGAPIRVMPLSDVAARVAAAIEAAATAKDHDHVTVDATTPFRREWALRALRGEP